ncbi:V-type proton ATPase catalytic subunit A [Raphanus sativus]|uniref:V-type proton ATPase catalytic subunit A n=1 Tax=Raphanus sativus TaxID=3726 RepID=A0A6J0M9K5_RAPSA|nr:V-type proton ATPase catalytic subunit A [Raphanus sativus]
MTFKESEYGYARKVSGPVVVADGMAGAAMYELSSRTFLSILASTLKLLSSSEEIVSGDNSKIIPCLWISRMERPTVGI